MSVSSSETTGKKKPFFWVGKVFVQEGRGNALGGGVLGKGGFT